MTTNRESIKRIELYLQALKHLGTDASPNDVAPDELGCADSVSQILLKTFPGIIKGSVSTRELNQQLNSSKHFVRVTKFLPGDIIMSPTGSGNGGLRNGHVGIVGEEENIMSNSSATGKWENNYNLKSWVARYRVMGGYPIFFYRIV